MSKHDFSHRDFPAFNKDKFTCDNTRITGIEISVGGRSVKDKGKYITIYEDDLRNVLYSYLGKSQEADVLLDKIKSSVFRINEWK